MKRSFFITLFTLSILVLRSQGKYVYSRNGSVKRQKQIVNQSCVANDKMNSVEAGLNYLLDEPKSVSEKNFKKYILSNYPNGFPKVSVRFCVVLQRNHAPCCSQKDIADSLTMDTKRLEYLTDLVLSYPVFSRVQFNEGENVKYLIITMGRYKSSALTVGFSIK